MEVQILIERYKDKIPATPTTKMECVRYLMLFMEIYKSEFQDFELKEDKVFDIIYDLPEAILVIFCNGVKFWANEGAVKACVQFFKDQVRDYGIFYRTAGTRVL